MIEREDLSMRPDNTRNELVARLSQGTLSPTRRDWLARLSHPGRRFNHNPATANHLFLEMIAELADRNERLEHRVAELEGRAADKVA